MLYSISISAHRYMLNDLNLLGLASVILLNVFSIPVSEALANARSSLKYWVVYRYSSWLYQCNVPSIPHNLDLRFHTDGWKGTIPGCPWDSHTTRKWDCGLRVGRPQCQDIPGILTELGTSRTWDYVLTD